MQWVGGPAHVGTRLGHCTRTRALVLHGRDADICDGTVWPEGGQEGYGRATNRRAARGQPIQGVARRNKVCKRVTQGLLGCLARCTLSIPDVAQSGTAIDLAPIHDARLARRCHAVGLPSMLPARAQLLYLCSASALRYLSPRNWACAAAACPPLCPLPRRQRTLRRGAWGPASSPSGGDSLPWATETAPRYRLVQNQLLQQCNQQCLTAREATGRSHCH